MIAFEAGFVKAAGFADGYIMNASKMLRKTMANPALRTAGTAQPSLFGLKSLGGLAAHGLPKPDIAKHLTARTGAMNSVDSLKSLAGSRAAKIPSWGATPVGGVKLPGQAPVNSEWSTIQNWLQRAGKDIQSSLV